MPKWRWECRECFSLKEEISGAYLKMGWVLTEGSQKQCISHTGLVQPQHQKISQPLLWLSSCKTDGNECGSVTLPLDWGKGARLQKEENVFFHMFIWKHNALLRSPPLNPHNLMWVSVLKGKRKDPKWFHVAFMTIVKLSCTAILLKDVLSSCLTSCIFCSPQNDMIGTNVVRVLGKIWVSRELWSRKCHLWGWICRKALYVGLEPLPHKQNSKQLCTPPPPPTTVDSAPKTERMGFIFAGYMQANSPSSWASYLDHKTKDGFPSFSDSWADQSIHLTPTRVSNVR